MSLPNLIYCAGGNKRFAEIALKTNYFYGARIPRDKPHFPIYFADHMWKKPNREAYMNELRRHKPYMATILDLEQSEQLNEVLSWAEEASQYSEIIVIIPKVSGIIRKIPLKINKSTVILGYSVPTKYGHTDVSTLEFAGRLVHLLGGSPHKQIKLYRSMKNYCEIFSVDGNYMQKMALKFNKFWTNGNAEYAENKWLPRLDEADGMKWKKDAPYEAFRRSCLNIQEAWKELFSED